MFGMGGFKKSDYSEEVENLKAVFSTTAGDFEVELYPKDCPETVWNFINLAEGRQETEKKGPFYDGLIFHRVIDNFMIQGGCPKGDGRGDPGYRFKDEFCAALVHNDKGVLSMANAGPGTNGSQFFITLGATPHLNNRHTVFGKVSRGIEVIDQIGNTQTGAMDRPVEDIIINTVTIVRD